MIDFKTIALPRMHIFVGNASLLCDTVWKVSQELPKYEVRVLQGRRMQTEDGLFQEFAAALQFPYYFGNNWPALDECLADLEWLPAEGYILFLSEAPLILANSGSSVEDLVEVLSQAADHWSVETHPGSPFQREARPFHVVFNCALEDESVVQSKLAALSPSRTLLE